MCIHLWRKSIANLLRIAPNFLCKAFIIKQMDGLVCVFPTWQKVSRKFKSYFKMSNNCVKTRPIEFQSCQHVTKYENIFFILHWRWDSIQFDCTISSLIHIWREYRVLICWQFFPNFLHWWNMHPRIVFAMHKVLNGRKCHWINVQFAPFSILFIEKLYWRSTPGYNGPLKLCPLALWKLSLGNEGRVEAGGQVTQNAQYRFQLKCEFKIQSFQFNARAL